MNELTTAMRSKILRLQETMLALPAGQIVECRVWHFFEGGLYGRAMLIPGGVTIVGKIHLHAHHNHIDFGDVLVATEDGTVRLGPCDFISKPGTKRVVHALQDTLWVTYHDNPDQTQDLAALEAQIIAPSYTALLTYQENSK